MNVSVNVIIDAICSLMVMVVFISNVRQKEQTGIQKLFNTLMIFVFVVLVLDIFGWVLDGKSFYGARTICLILDTAYYLFQILYCRLWLRFVDNWISGSKKRKMSTKIIFSIPMYIEIVLILINIKTGWIFLISEDNIYERGSFYSLNLIPYYLYILTAIIYATSIVLINKNEKSKKNQAILTFMFLPICGMIIQSISYGISWLWPFTAISLLMVYLNMQLEKLSEQQLTAARKAARTEQMANELANSRVKIMLSQIQPHFIYNSLSVIQALCSTEPELAAQATEDFAIYLRCNMDSLNSDEPIPFEKELQHTKRYLSLEKLRFDKYLSIDFDIQTTDFKLPSLTLQPIAENAVRYGITKREEGGQLYISTRETETAYEVIIKDTGIGFNPYEEKSDAKSHIGITNVGHRLKTMCGGSLSITSKQGVGTEAVIIIPKEYKENEWE